MPRRGSIALVALLLMLPTAEASAQLKPLGEGVDVGQWTFYPSLELRLRGEYHRNPVDVGGDSYARSAIQSDEFQSSVPPRSATYPAAYDQYVLSERARLGLEVRYDVVSGKLVLQDARALGTSPGPLASNQAGFGIFEPHQAYIDVRTSQEDPWMWIRAGRQTVSWGDGRLVGDSDWSPRARSLDALRVHLDLDEIDIELMAAMLAFSTPIPPPHTSDGRSLVVVDDGGAEGIGAQLYGVDATWRIWPLLGIELTALARIARDPLPQDLTRGDTYTLDGRLFGDHRGFEYAAEGAYQLGRVAGYGVNRGISAFAFAGRVGWQTALPWKFKFGARGSYASGDASGGTGETLTRFDPILPTQHVHHGMMDLAAWSNMFDAGAMVSAMPHDDVTVGTGYAFVGLAEPNDRWSTGYLVPVGVDGAGGSRSLGHEVDSWLKVAPWDSVSFSGGYGLFILAKRAEAILDNAGRHHAGLLHYGFVQAELRAP